MFGHRTHSWLEVHDRLQISVFPSHQTRLLSVLARDVPRFPEVLYLIGKEGLFIAGEEKFGLEPSNAHPKA